MAINPVGQLVDFAHVEEHLHVKRSLVLSALSGAAHSYVGHYLSIIHPVGGLCYGVAFAISIWAIHAISRIANISTNNKGAVLAKFYLCVIGSPFISALVTTAVGFPINSSLGTALNILTIYIALSAAIYTTLAALAVTTVIACIAVVHRMRRDGITAQLAMEGLYEDLRPYIPERIQAFLVNVHHRWMDLRQGWFELRNAINANMARHAPLERQEQRPRHLDAFRRFHENERARRELLRPYAELEAQVEAQIL